MSIIITILNQKDESYLLKEKCRTGLLSCSILDLEAESQLSSA